MPSPPVKARCHVDEYLRPCAYVLLWPLIAHYLVLPLLSFNIVSGFQGGQRHSRPQDYFKSVFKSFWRSILSKPAIPFQTSAAFKDLQVSLKTIQGRRSSVPRPHTLIKPLKSDSKLGSFSSLSLGRSKSPKTFRFPTVRPRPQVTPHNLPAFPLLLPHLPVCSLGFTLTLSRPIFLYFWQYYLCFLS
ncbi:hypothetical protein B0H11DRAFT_1115040 [Mycena galericulata]|nr:hypothetical protein B0H11DRAFT_1115040 [Mycena galericulata]